MAGAVSNKGFIERDVLQSGGASRSHNSARAGFLPAPLDRVPLPALRGLPVYVRLCIGLEEGTPDPNHPGFRLYCSETVQFSEEHRQRLLERGVKFVYLRMADQSQYRRQTEENLTATAADPAVAIAEKSAIVYETSVELVNELLSEPEMLVNSPRLEQVSRAITTLVINNPSAFTHLFAASHHDFYTATHMVNVGTWMVPLAYELGYRDPEMLNLVCQAGLLHDMGKTTIPEEILNKRGKLTEDDWAMIKGHPEAGYRYLMQYESVNPIVLRVTREHHERMDGSGYPQGLRSKDIHPISRICAVVDSFDAMTAFRPFKERTLSVPDALAIIQAETPRCYDEDVVAAWLRILQRGDVQEVGPVQGMGQLQETSCRREHTRTSFHCHARMHTLIWCDGTLVEGPGFPVVAHSISRGGLGFLTQRPIERGAYVRLYLQAPGWQGRPLDGQTVRCRTYQDSWNEVGLSFGAPGAEQLKAA